MKLKLLLLTLALMASAALRAETFAGREDVTAFVEEMHAKHGFDTAELDMLFGRAKPIPAVIKAILPPKDPTIRSWAVYRQRFIEPRRIAAGLRFRQQYAADLARAEAKYGVPAEIVLAIIGVETIYGRQTGRFGTFAALATLAFDYPPRAELFRQELEALLLLARDEHRDPLSYKGSFAGALGLPQFLPSSKRQWGTDFDGDGRVDLASSPADAIGSVANFLKEHGWVTGEPVAVPVTVSGDPTPLIDEGIRPGRLPSDMAAFGVQTSNAPERVAALIDLVTPAAATEYWLGYQNFYVLTRYNRSTFYAMAVFQLAEEFRAIGIAQGYRTASRPTPSRDMRRRS